ncbi:MAG: hypothetical protein AB1847_03500 [bacterium]
MRTKHIRDRKISALIDGELSIEESEALFGHITKCQRCKGKLLQWQRTEHYLKHGEREIVPPAFFEQKILSHVRQDAASGAKDAHQPSIFGLAFRFATAVLIALGIFLGTVMGAQLTAIWINEKEGVDLIAVLSSQDGASPAISEVGLYLSGESS